MSTKTKRTPFDVAHEAKIQALAAKFSETVAHDARHRHGGNRCPVVDEAGNDYESQQEAAYATGVSHAAVSLSIAKGRRVSGIRWFRRGTEPPHVKRLAEAKRREREGTQQETQ